jgi:hypothetical protein
MLLHPVGLSEDWQQIKEEVGLDAMEKIPLWIEE